MSSLFKSAVVALGAGFLLAAPEARADVIQIGPKGFVWVAGAPEGQATPRAAPGAPPAVAQHPSYTDAALEAGPSDWRARVAALAAKYDISPALLEAVVWQESRWRAAAVSPVGAQGLAQLMPATARQMGVAIGDPTANLEGGARYLRMQLDAFGGDVEKALAAYNAGPGRVQSAGGVPRIPETQAYVAAIMARLASRVRSD